MPTDVLLLVLTAALAAVAAGAAAVALRAARRGPSGAVPPTRLDLPRHGVLVPLDERRTEVPAALVPRVVDDRLIVPPSEAQVVNTALGRPQVRLAVVARGLAYALRAESRDRIVALMRREYRRRRAERLRAGRRAVRAAQPVTADAWMEQSWVGELEPGARPSPRTPS